MARRDLAVFFNSGLDYVGVPSKKHPEGRTYRVPSVDARTGLWLSALSDVGMKAALGLDLDAGDAASLRLDDHEEQSLYQRLFSCALDCRAPVEETGEPGPPCGSVFDQMLEDGVSWDAVQAIGRDAYLNFAIGQEAADDALAKATQEAAGEPVAPQAGATQQPTQRKPRTPRKPAGSSSKKGSTGTRARTRAQASTPSSTSLNASVSEAAVPAAV